jgi:alkanesulfonate monooxygenase SsuD/methylene tetrahydromethanopterin reductase-like flavin-dependent oxidoreductase (luciferase family)
VTAAPSDGRELRFGVSLPPRAAVDLRSHLGLVEAAEAGGLELAGIMDHPYLARDHDTLSLLAFLLARTERLRFFPTWPRSRSAHPPCWPRRWPRWTS